MIKGLIILLVWIVMIVGIAIMKKIATENKWYPVYAVAITVAFTMISLTMLGK